MTTEPTADGRTDAQTDAADAQRPAETKHSSGPRGLLKGAAGALLGLAGISAATGSASASGSSKRLLVIGDGNGQHTYEISMRGGGQIQKATHAGGNDSVTSSNGQQVRGELWHWNVDSYTFSGAIDYVEADGSVAFHFLDGAFRADSWIGITGQSPGRHLYMVGSNSADIDMGKWSTEYVDSDDGPQRTEQRHTPDHVSGAVRDSNYDGYDIESSDPVQHITVEDGHLRFE